MKITLIYPLRFRLNFEKTKYKPGENKFNNYIDEFVVFPINHVLADFIPEKSLVEVILIETLAPNRNTSTIIEEAKEEISGKLEKLKAEYIFKIIEAPYADTKNRLANIYENLCANISSKSKILIDMTYGPKYMPLVLFCVLNYAEKYLDCEIVKIYYGLFDNIKGNNGTMVDFTPLYLLNTFGTIFDGAKESFDNFSTNILK